MTSKKNVKRNPKRTNKVRSPSAAVRKSIHELVAEAKKALENTSTKPTASTTNEPASGTKTKEIPVHHTAEQRETEHLVRAHWRRRLGALYFDGHFDSLGVSTCPAELRKNILAEAKKLRLIGEALLYPLTRWGTLLKTAEKSLIHGGSWQFVKRAQAFGEIVREAARQKKMMEKRNATK